MNPAIITLWPLIGTCPLLPNPYVEQNIMKPRALIFLSLPDPLSLLFHSSLPRHKGSIEEENSLTKVFIDRCQRLYMLPDRDF